MNEKCNTFKGQANPEKELLCIFQAIGSIPLQRCRASITEQQSTKVRAKGIDPIWG